MPIYVLATDARWPLDADAAASLRALEAATGALTLWRVPDTVYGPARGAAAETTVVLAKEEATPPPASWDGPVCWHVRQGCEAVYNVPGLSSAPSFEIFLAGELETTTMAWPTRVGGLLVAFILCLGLWKRFRRS